MKNTRKLFIAVTCLSVFILVAAPLHILSCSSTKWLLKVNKALGLKYRSFYCTDFRLELQATVLGVQHSISSNQSITHSIHSRNKPELYYFAKSKNFIFHAGSDSPGGDISVTAHNKRSIQQLKELCHSTSGCIGFTSSGTLKQKLLPYRNWTKFKSEERGLYVLDTNHCNNEKQPVVCQNNLTCVSETEGRYSCESKLEVPSEASSMQQSSMKDTIHVVLSVDKAQFPGVLPLLLSLKQHHKNDTQNICLMSVYIVVNTDNRKGLNELLSCGIQRTKHFKIDIIEFDVPKHLQQLITVISHESLSSTANFARFYFYKLFPSLSHILYLDVDTLVQHDISELWKEVISADELLVVVPRKKPNYGFHFLKGNISQMFQERYGKNISMSGPTFNAGIVGINLNKWRKNNITREVLYWMTENRKTPLWFQGTQPILYLVGYKDWKGVDSRWNVQGLGWTSLPAKAVSKAYILHWNGPRKPWSRRGRCVHIWRKYNTGVCNRRGTCKDRGNGQGICNCNDGFKGQYCEKKVLFHQKQLKQVK